MIKTSKLFLIVFLLTTFSFAQNYKIKEDISLLVSSEEELSLPKISPDGNYVAFGEYSNDGIYLISYSGGEIKNLSRESAAAWNMKWSPNSNEIITRVNFWGEDNISRESAVMLYNIDGGSKNLSGKVQDLDMPFWSIDASSVAWFDINNKLQVNTLYEGNKSFKLNNSDRLISYNNNSEQILYTPNGNILNTAWTNDYKKVVLEIAGVGLIVFNTATNEIFDLGYGEYPSWITDEHIVFMKVGDDGTELIEGDIYISRFDGDSQLNLTENRNEIFLYPSSSYNGRIVFQSFHGKIYKMEIEIE